MAEAPLRADMAAPMTRSIQTEQKIDTRLHVAAVPNEAPLVDTRTVGMASTYTGEHKDWPEWSFEFAALMGSANPESIEAVRWAAMEANPIAAAVGTSGSTTHSKYGVV